MTSDAIRRLIMRTDGSDVHRVTVPHSVCLALIYTIVKNDHLMHFLSSVFADVETTSSG